MEISWSGSGVVYVLDRRRLVSRGIYVYMLQMKAWVLGLARKVKIDFGMVSGSVIFGSLVIKSLAWPWHINPWWPIFFYPKPILLIHLEDIAMATRYFLVRRNSRRVLAPRLMTLPNVMTPIPVPPSMPPLITRQRFFLDVIWQMCDVWFYLLHCLIQTIGKQCIYLLPTDQNIYIIEQVGKYEWITHILLQY
jgi:hypothetical protein